MQCQCGVPLFFTAYVSPVGDLIHSHGMSYHQFADDMHASVHRDEHQRYDANP